MSTKYIKAFDAWNTYQHLTRVRFRRLFYYVERDAYINGYLDALESEGL